MKKSYEILVKVENKNSIQLDPLTMPYLLEAHDKKLPPNHISSEAQAEEWIIENGDYKYTYVILPIYKLG